MSGWYDDGSEVQAQMEAELRRRQIEEAQENRRLEAEQKRLAEREHELKCEAAPELYEALKAMLRSYDQGGVVTVCHPLAIARAALVKAEGRND
jgi:hypothetical protein